MKCNRSEQNNEIGFYFGQIQRTCRLHMVFDIGWNIYFPNVIISKCSLNEVPNENN